MKTKTILKVLGVTAIVVMMITIGILIYQLRQKSQEILDGKITINALTDTLHKTRDTLGIETATIASFQVSDLKQFLQIKSQDSTIKNLQASVNKNKNRLGNQGSVTNFSTSTAINKYFKTDSVKYSQPTSVGKTFPIYTTKFNLKNWVTGNIISGQDSTQVQLNIKNEYSVVLGEEKGKPFAEVTNYNPYSTTSTLRSFSIKNGIKQKTWGIAITTGPGIQYYSGKVFAYPSINIGLTKMIWSW